MRKRKRCGKPRFIFVVGGVMSSVGKGAATSSIAAILKSYGYRVTAMKIDPYVNVDAGTLNPVEHGEVFVTDDGVETDQDIGNYERFLGEDLSAANYATQGSIWQSVIARERSLGYDGKTVELYPHVSDEVVARVDGAAEKTGAQFVVVEIGGTVGEDQNKVFFRAIQEMRRKRRGRVLIVLVSYLPYAGAELKTKPTQQAHERLNAQGLQADFILARADKRLDKPRYRKIAEACGLSARDVISAPDVKSIYEIPGNFERDGFGRKLLAKFGMSRRAADLSEWRDLVARVTDPPSGTVRIGIVGKYFRSGKGVVTDAYISVIEAVKHAAWHLGVRPDIEWLDAEDFERKSASFSALDELGGIIVPGGFGSRGVEGKLAVIRHARERAIPYFGLCYGMQLAVVEFARNVVGLADANTTEIDRATPHPVIDVMPEQKKNIEAKDFGASMRLGAQECVLVRGSVAARAYRSRATRERHRHRYEVNNDYCMKLAACGLWMTGTSADGRLVEIVEVRGLPFFLGTQFHPEYRSRPLAPHPLFIAFIKAAMSRRNG